MRVKFISGSPCGSSCLSNSLGGGGECCDDPAILAEARLCREKEVDSLHAFPALESCHAGQKVADSHGLNLEAKETHRLSVLVAPGKPGL